MNATPARCTLIAWFALGGLAQRAPALINLDGTRNQIFVSAGASFAWDSNVFAEAKSSGDYTSSASGGIEFKRRAGIIAVNASMSVNLTRFIKYSSENSFNPTFSLELNKTTGRTTGALTINPYRESRSDSAVNIRTQSWNFPVGLSLKYPISERFYLTSGTSYLSRRYVDDARLANYTDYSEGLNLFYVFTSKLDLMGGYRLRVADTSIGTRTNDHAFTFGATGGLRPKLNGAVNIGYQFRTVQGSGETFTGLTTSSSFTWTATRKFNMTAQLSRDFSTTATATSVDSFGAQLRATYVFTRKLAVNAGAGFGRNHFLGKNAPHRADSFFSWDVGTGYSFSEHFTVSGSYSFMHNWSNVQFSEFTRNGCSLSVSSHY